MKRSLKVSNCDCGAALRSRHGFICHKCGCLFCMACKRVVDGKNLCGGCTNEPRIRLHMPDGEPESGPQLPQITTLKMHPEEEARFDAHVREVLEKRHAGERVEEDEV